MKKIISVLAMALLVIGAAQAQEQVRKMFVQLKNGQVVRYNTEDIEDVTFKMDNALPDVPTTIEEAKAMIVGYWKWNIPIDEDVVFEGTYFIITEDLEILYCLKAKDSVTNEDGEISPYAGKYVVLYKWGEVTFPSEDPTTFIFGDEWHVGTNLQSDSFIIFDSTVAHPCVRVKPFEYIIPEDD